MSEYREIKGELFEIAENDDSYDMIVHGCNCFCNFGAGFALAVRKKMPALFEADLATEKGDRTKMGRISYAECRLGDKDIIGVNAYTQFRYGRGGPHFEYGSLRSCMERCSALLYHYGNEGRRIIMPKIGSGYAGGDWKDISEILRQCADLHDMSITVVEYDK